MSSFSPDAQKNGIEQAFHDAAMMGGARSITVNRTHRVVREQALTLQEQRRKSRSLWVPLMFFSSLMLVIGYGIWSTLDSFDVASSVVPDANDQMIYFLLWFLPVTALVVGLVWFKRSRGRAESEV